MPSSWEKLFIPDHNSQNKYSHKGPVQAQVNQNETRYASILIMVFRDLLIPGWSEAILEVLKLVRAGAVH